MSLGFLIEKGLQGINEKNAAATGEIICTPPPRVAKGQAASTPSRHNKRREGSTSEHLGGMSNKVDGRKKFRRVR
jgi:hypothetical protein